MLPDIPNPIEWHHLTPSTNWKPGAVSEYSFITLPGLTVGFPCSSVVKNLSAIPETEEMWVRSLGQKDPLEEEMATHSSILAWEVPWTEEPGVHGVAKE